MSTKFIAIALLLLALPTIAAAQNKISGTMHCNRPDTDQQLDVGDVSGHTISLTQATCTWTKAMVFDGVQDTDGISSQISEVDGDNLTSHGYFVDTMANGDKIFLKYEAIIPIAGGDTQSVHGKWTFTGGTGKFKGIQGDGTFSGHGASYDLEGEYALAK